MQSDPESTSRPVPESPIIGLIENSAATTCQETGTSGTSKESTPEAKKSSPSAANTGYGVAGGSENPTVRVVPFLSLAQSTHEEMGKELFDDPLLSVEDVKKLADYMQWSFKFTKVRFLLLSLLMSSGFMISDIVCCTCRMLPIGPS